MKVTIDLDNIDLSEYIESNGEDGLDCCTITEILKTEVVNTISAKLINRESLTWDIKEQLRKPIQKALDKYIDVDMLKECVEKEVKQRVGFAGTAYYQVFEKEVVEIVDRIMAERKAKDKKDLEMIVGVQIANTVKHTLREILHTDKMSKFIDEDKLTKYVIDILGKEVL